MISSLRIYLQMAFLLSKAVDEHTRHSVVVVEVWMQLCTVDMLPVRNILCLHLRDSSRASMHNLRGVEI